jgi:hypothetical protein
LSIVHPAQHDFYKTHATQSQNHAITQANGAELNVTAKNGVLMYLFSATLALPMLPDKLVYHSADFKIFLDHFVQSLYSSFQNQLSLDTHEISLSENDSEVRWSTLGYRRDPVGRPRVLRNDRHTRSLTFEGRYRQWTFEGIDISILPRKPLTRGWGRSSEALL